MQVGQRARNAFVVLWVTVTVLKAIVAARLPLFVDEAFYWQEGRHLAAAYSDLPGLTAWMTRLGGELAGHHAFGIHRGWQPRRHKRVMLDSALHKVNRAGVTRAWPVSC